MSRRKILKAAGATSGLGVLSTVSAGAVDYQAVDWYERALEVREQTGSIEQFREALAREGGQLATSDLSVQKAWTPANEDGEVSTQALQKADFNLYMTMSSNAGSNPYVDLNWEITVDFGLENDGGEPPQDAIGLTFESADYDYDGYTYSGSGTIKNDTGFHGATFVYNDIPCSDYWAAGADCPPTLGTTVTVHNHAGMRVVPDQTSDPSKRQVFGNYVHTWEDIEISAISFTSDAPFFEVGVTNADYKWNTPAEASISEDEMDIIGCC